MMFAEDMMNVLLVIVFIDSYNWLSKARYCKQLHRKLSACES